MFDRHKISYVDFCNLYLRFWVYYHNRQIYIGLFMVNSFVIEKHSVYQIRFWGFWLMIIHDYIVDICKSCKFQSICVEFIYLGFYIAFNTVQVISRWVVGRPEETNTYSSLGFCTVNCQPTASNYQLSHLRPCRELNPGLRGGRRECYHSATVAPYMC